MAQSKSFFGLRKGSTKSLTFQVLNGKQITKDRVYNVKNPQTLAQMQQRALMATAVTAYSNLKAICDHSFEGVEVGSKTMSEFIKLNLAKLSSEMPNVNITEYKSGNYASNKYIVSKGTLVAPNGEIKGNKYQINTGAIAGEEIAIKWKDIAATMGIKKDGMLTLMLVSQGQCDWLRIKFNEAMWDMDIVADDSNMTELSNVGAIEGNSYVYADILQFHVDDAQGKKLFINLTIAEDECVAAIISERSEGIWKRSTAYLEGNISYFYESAFSTYPINTTLLLNGGKMPTNIIAKK